ncbi:signal peptide peptidase SppA [uncultured Alsobacter sp.]|uniref:signal peptide peptidase SppA n=1 Tax=uncultured Alsobacter sp. TaxID=1748258 RepID=UPI0025F84D59|nr:signal peptide peptidase SppA [uncultured Alsobacter sp.]
MTAESDYLLDRRRLTRRVTFWRVAAFLVALVAIVGTALAVAGPRLGTAQSHIARVDISGFISGDEKTLDLLKSVGKSNAKAVIVQIDSPGGTVTGAELLFHALRELSAEKPTVAVVRSLAASGGYIAAMGTDRIVAQETSLVGSIGVLFQFPNFTRLLDTVGVKMETTKSSPLKASPNPFEVTTPEQQAAVQALIADSFAWFKRIVAERRGLAGTELATVSDGRVFSGSQAVGLKLIDEVGTQKQAIAWLEKEKGVPKDLPVREWKRSGAERFGFWSASAGIADVLGFDQVATLLAGASQGMDRGALEGLLALWRP